MNDENIRLAAWDIFLIYFHAKLIDRLQVKNKDFLKFLKKLSFPQFWGNISVDEGYFCELGLYNLILPFKWFW